MKEKIVDLITVLAVGAAIIAASIAGKRITEKNDLEQIGSILNSGNDYSVVNNNKWLILDESGGIQGYLYNGEGRGYNGKVRIATVTKTDGSIISVSLISHTETPSFVNKILRRNYTERFTGLEAGELLNSEENADVISGATITCNAIREGIKDGYVSGENLPRKDGLRISAGWPEYMVLMLFILSVLISLKRLRPVRKYLQWLSWLVSVIFLGFVLGQPLTLPRFVSVFNGYMPVPATELFIILLVVLAIAFILLSGKNHYCRYVCPFGATQEILAAIGNASAIRPKRFRLAKYLQWGITLAAVILALLMNNPSIAEYSVFGAFFQLTGTTIIFILLMMSIIMSLFVKRPWCNYLCPVDGVMAYLRTLRRVVLNILRS